MRRTTTNNGGGYSYGGNAPDYGYASGYSPYPVGPNAGDQSSKANASGLRRRTAAPPSGAKSTSTTSRTSSSSVVKQLDFMFPKVDSEFTVKSDRGGMATMIAVMLVTVLGIAEILTWVSQNQSISEHIYVNTDLGKRMRINMNITFPSLACEDLHVDAMDVAGDSQIDVDDTLVKKQLRWDGRPRSDEEIKVDMNARRREQERKEKVLREKLPEDYCGPCFGAHEKEDQCCQTCDELIEAYKKKRWKTSLLIYTAEQCIREGRDKKEPKRMTKGQGCNLSGYMTVNRVAGNFHIAMGEGIERDGRHIHTFVPEDAPNFNASHIIHRLTFGPAEDEGAPMNGITKIVAHEHGTTGLFQYFIKVIPVTFKGGDTITNMVATSDVVTNSTGKEEGGEEEAGEGEEEQQDDEASLETHRYFFTERFRPLMKEFLEEEHTEEDDPKQAGVEAGHKGGHSNKDHHRVQNSVLPGVFFIYEIFPFAVEVSQTSVPVTHLLIRLMATIGGVFTVVSWVEAAFCAPTVRRRAF